MLEQLRNQIDEVDQQIIDLLALRFELVKKV
jgi:chorismate mutase